MRKIRITLKSFLITLLLVAASYSQRGIVGVESVGITVSDMNNSLQLKITGLHSVEGYGIEFLNYFFY